MAAHAAPPSVPGVDAPELARLGPAAVGMRTLALVQPGQADVLRVAGDGSVPVADRRLEVDVWYPALPAAGATPATYRASLPGEPPRPPAAFEIPGLAVRDAPPAGSGHPLVIVSHGYSNDPVTMSWLTENLASKGYVVAAIRHADPDISDTRLFVGPLIRRPLDIAFVARSLPGALGALIDPTKTALIGYSMGGYGVLTNAGAVLDPASPAVRAVPGAALLPYASGGARQRELAVPGLRAVIAMAPAGAAPFAVWGADGLKGIAAPLMLIAGDADRVVDYGTGARAFFDAATGAPRYLLTFLGAGHAIGLGPAPAAMRARLWDLDWFEDPVWRKDRLNAISLHFITAFLDRHVNRNAAAGAFLDVATVRSADGVWPALPRTDHDMFSPASGRITAWKGFQRNHAQGLELRRADPR